MTEPERQAPGFQRQLGLFDATMLVAGTMIGSGIFAVAGYMARDVGAAGWFVLAWILTGIMTLAGALCYAELASKMPHAGGQYVFLRESLGPTAAFLYGWAVFLVIQTGSIAAVCVVFASYLGELFPLLGAENVLFQPGWVLHVTVPVPGSEQWASVYGPKPFTINASQIVALVVTLLLTWANCLGVRMGKWIQNFFTIGKTTALVVLLVIGLTVAAEDRLLRANFAHLWADIERTPTYANISARLSAGFWGCSLLVLAATMTYSLFAADAWNNVTYTAEEVHEPKRTVPLSLILGTGLVVVLYWLTNIGYVASLSMDQIAKAPDNRVTAEVVRKVWPHLGVSFLSVAIMVSTFGCANGMILMGARLYYAMARDGLFFASAGQLNRHKVPGVALWMQGIWAGLLIFSGSYDELLEYAMFAALLFYVLTVIGLCRLRSQNSTTHAHFSVPGYPWLPLGYLAMCVFVMAGLVVVKPIYSGAGLLLILAGWPVYYYWRGKASVTAR